MSGDVTEELSSEEVSTIVSELATIYGVSEADVDLSVDYVASGTLDVVIPEGVSDEEVAAAVQESLSGVLGVHPKDVVVSVDNGVVSYQITGDSYADVESLLADMNEADFVSSVNALTESESGIVVTSVTPKETIEVVASATVDTTDATGDLDGAAVAVSGLSDSLGLTESSAENAFVTSAPTFTPSSSPVTSLPTQTPSITGLVVSVDISTATDSALSEEEVAYLEGVVANAYGVSSEDVSTVVEYQTTGSMTVAVGENVSDEEVVSEVTSTLSEALGDSEENIEVVYDAQSGEVTYTVTTTSFEDSQAALSVLEDEGSATALSSLTDVVSITSVTPSEEILAEVTVVVDADDVSVPLQQAENAVDAVLGDTYSAETEGISFSEKQYLFLMSQLCHCCSIGCSQHVSFEKAYFVGSIRFAYHHWFSCFCGIDERSDCIFDRKRNSRHC